MSIRMIGSATMNVNTDAFVSGRLHLQYKMEVNMLKRLLYHLLFWIGTLGVLSVNVLLLDENPIICTLIVVVVFAYLLYFMIFFPLIDETGKDEH